jgi:hypothetical protein
MSKPLRILIGLGIVAIVYGAYLFFGVQTFLIWEARQEPLVWITPVQLLDSSISKAPGKQLSYFGYVFEVPWDDIDQERTKVIGTNNAIIVFRSGNVLSFWSDPPKGLMSILQGTGKIDQKVLRQVFGNEPAQSDYGLERTILDITPADFSLLTPKRLAIQQGMLFSMKTTILPRGSESGVFLINTNEFKGFQYGRPQNPPKPLIVKLFKSDGTVDIFFGQKLEGSTAISQADVNRVVQTLHKVTAEKMVSKASLHN